MTVATMSTTDITDQQEWQFYIRTVLTRLLHKNIVLHVTNIKSMINNEIKMN